jgi:hypothetical protein
MTFIIKDTRQNAVSYGHKMFMKLTPVKYAQLQSNVGTIKNDAMPSVIIQIVVAPF